MFIKTLQEVDKMVIIAQSKGGYNQDSITRKRNFSTAIMGLKWNFERLQPNQKGGFYNSVIKIYYDEED